jgi:hypothetical protein
VFNTASQYGGGSFVEPQAAVEASDNMYIINNIIWGNDAPSGADLYIQNDFDGDYLPFPITILKNDFDQSSAGIYIRLPFPIDPSNLDNVNPSFVDSSTGNFQLNEGSPCIDSGSNNLPFVRLVDIADHPRFLDGDGNGTTIVDIGAYEFGDPLWCENQHMLPVPFSCSCSGYRVRPRIGDTR